MNTRDIENGKEEFSERCIRSAEMVSYFVKNDLEITKSVERAKQLAEMLDIDEIHFFTPEGEIYSGTIRNISVIHLNPENKCIFFFPC